MINILVYVIIFLILIFILITALKALSRGIKAKKSQNKKNIRSKNKNDKIN